MSHHHGLPPTATWPPAEPPPSPAQPRRRVWAGAAVAAVLVSSALGATAWFLSRGGEAATYPIRDTEPRDVDLNSAFIKSISAPHKVVSGYSYRSSDGGRTVMLFAPPTALRADLADENAPGEAVLQEAWKNIPGRFDRIIVADADLHVLTSSTSLELRKRYGARKAALEHSPGAKISAEAATRTRAGNCAVPRSGERSESCTQLPSSLPATQLVGATRAWCGVDDGTLDIASISQSSQDAGVVPDPEGHVTIVLAGQRSDRMIHIPVVVRPGSTDSDAVLLTCGSSARQMSVSDYLSAGQPVAETSPSTEDSASPSVPGEDQGPLPWDWDEEAPTATDMEVLGVEWTRHASAQECRTRMAALATPERLKQFANNGDETIRSWSGQYSAADFTALVTMGRFVRALQAEGHDDPPGTVAARIPDICEVFATSDPGQ